MGRAQYRPRSSARRRFREHTVVLGPQPAPDSPGFSNWVQQNVHQSLAALPTTDSGVSTSAGPRPKPDFSGGANPQLMTTGKAASDSTIAERVDQANVATRADFGEKGILPTIATQQLRASVAIKPPNAASRADGLRLPPQLNEEARANVNTTLNDWQRGKVGEQVAAYGQQRSSYVDATRKRQLDGNRSIAEESHRTRSLQQQLRDNARADVNGARARWQAENRQIQQTYATQAYAKRAEIDGQIQQKVGTTNREVDQKLTDAEKAAETERTKADGGSPGKEARGRKPPPKAGGRKRAGAVSSAIESVRSAINNVFVQLRKTVRGIIDAARAAVGALIDAVRNVVTGLIKQFGEFLKGIVDVALAAFPNAAARARAWIDSKVSSSTQAVNRAADRLKERANATLDRIAGLDAALEQAAAGLQQGDRRAEAGCDRATEATCSGHALGHAARVPAAACRPDQGVGRVQSAERAA